MKGVPSKTPRVSLVVCFWLPYRILSINLVQQKRTVVTLETMGTLRLLRGSLSLGVLGALIGCLSGPCSDPLGRLGFRVLWGFTYGVERLG